MPKNVGKTNDDQKLEFYGLFKQATVGDVNTGTLKPFALLRPDFTPLSQTRNVRPKGKSEMGCVEQE